MILAVLMLVLAQVGAPAPAAAGEREAILAVVQAFFDTMAASDAAGARRVLMPDGRFVSVRDADGTRVVRALTVEKYLADMPGRTGKSRERMWNPEVRVHGPIAVVWTPYDFWVDGKFSHCGVDAFDVVKTAEGWKVAGAIYTVERTGCSPSPLGPLKEGDR